MSKPLVATVMLWGITATTTAATPTEAKSTAATLREARVAIVLSPRACDVASHFSIDTAEPIVIDHRVMLGDGAQPPEFVVLGALAGRADTIGRTANLPVSLTGTGRNEYTVRYRLTLYGSRLDRCPLLVPSAPTDGLSRAIAIAVDVPRGTTRLPGEFPALTWENGRGRVTLGHVPAFVRVPVVAAGDPVTSIDTLDVRRAIDIAAMLAIGVATLAWVTLHRPTLHRPTLHKPTLRKSRL